MNNSELKHIISNGKTEEAIEILIKKYQEKVSSQESKKIVLIKARFKKLAEKNLHGTISNEEKQIEINKINSSLIDLIDGRDDEFDFTEKSTNLNSPKVLYFLGFLVLIIIGGIFIQNNFPKEQSSEELIEILEFRRNEINDLIEKCVYIVDDSIKSNPFLEDTSANYNFYNPNELEAEKGKYEKLKKILHLTQAELNDLVDKAVIALKDKKLVLYHELTVQIHQIPKKLELNSIIAGQYNFNIISDYHIYYLMEEITDKIGHGTHIYGILRLADSLNYKIETDTIMLLDSFVIVKELNKYR